jgi:hypothetical protein
MFSALLTRLKQRFSPQRIRVGSKGAQALPGGGRRGIRVVVGRELCLFTTVSAAGVPAKLRASMLRLAVRKAAPFDDADFSVAWFGDTAAVWFWSRSAVLDASDGLLSDSPSLQFVPEALFLGTAVDGDASQLLTTDMGWHGRIWRDGRLLADRWWPAPPAPPVWQAFVRGAGLPAATALPAGTPVSLAETAWVAQHTQASRWNRARLEAGLPTLGVAIGAAAMLVACYEMGALARAAWDIHHVRERTDQLEAPLQAILDARQRADIALTETQAIAALLPVADQSSLLIEFGERLPGTEAPLLRWRLLESGQIEVAVRLANGDLESAVSRLEESPAFSSVRSKTTGTPDETVIELAVSVPAEGAP